MARRNNTAAGSSSRDSREATPVVLLPAQTFCARDAVRPGARTLPVSRCQRLGKGRRRTRWTAQVAVARVASRACVSSADPAFPSRLSQALATSAVCIDPASESRLSPALARSDALVSAFSRRCRHNSVPHLGACGSDSVFLLLRLAVRLARSGCVPIRNSWILARHLADAGNALSVLHRLAGKILQPQVSLWQCSLSRGAALRSHCFSSMDWRSESSAFGCRSFAIPGARCDRGSAENPDPCSAVHGCGD